MPRTRIVVTLAVALCSLFAVMGTGSAAHAAYAPAFNERMQYLASNPTTGDPWAIISRQIYLAAGCYERDLAIKTPSGQIYNGQITKGAIYLSAGTYRWEDYLIPEPLYSYTLEDELAGLSPQTEPSYWTFDDLRLDFSGNYLWGTELRWLSAICPPY